jgi:hypothetical protein
MTPVEFRSSSGGKMLTLTLGSRRFSLREDADLTEFEERLTRAVRAGAEVVELPTDGESTVRALITPAVPVVIERSGPARVTATDLDGESLSWLECELGEAL